MATIERAALYPAPGSPGSPVELKARYENFIGGNWVANLSLYNLYGMPMSGELTLTPRDFPAAR